MSTSTLAPSRTHQVVIDNPRRLRLTWVMRHRYRHGVPFGIDRNTGKVGLVKNIGPRALENYYVKVGELEPWTGGKRRGPGFSAKLCNFVLWL